MSETSKKYQFTLGIVVPTYKERDNIENLLNRVKVEVEKHSIVTTLLVMDDSSPDGTADIVTRLIPILNSDYLTIQIKVRPGKLGLGSAYVQGFQVLKDSCEYLLEMDADLSHKPEYVNIFLEKVKMGNDLVIGSRYIKGGGVEDWGIIRKGISSGASIYCQWILGISINDWTGGYNMYRSTVFDTVKLDCMIAEGYLFQIEMKYKTVKNNFKWIESPIVFPDRSAGHSKFDKKILLEALIGVWKLRFTKVV